MANRPRDRAVQETEQTERHTRCDLGVAKRGLSVRRKDCRREEGAYALSLYHDVYILTPPYRKCAKASLGERLPSHLS